MHQELEKHTAASRREAEPLQKHKKRCAVDVQPHTNFNRGLYFLSETCACTLLLSASSAKLPNLGAVFEAVPLLWGLRECVFWVLRRVPRRSSGASRLKQVLRSHTKSMSVAVGVVEDILGFRLQVGEQHL